MLLGGGVSRTQQPESPQPMSGSDKGFYSTALCPGTAVKVWQTYTSHSSTALESQHCAHCWCEQLSHVLEGAGWLCRHRSPWHPLPRALLKLQLTQIRACRPWLVENPTRLHQDKLCQTTPTQPRSSCGLALILSISAQKAKAFSFPLKQAACLPCKMLQPNKVLQEKQI